MIRFNQSHLQSNAPSLLSLAWLRKAEKVDVVEHVELTTKTAVGKDPRW